MLVLIQMAALAVAISVASVTLTMSAIFRRPRRWIAERSEFFGTLAHCPYCVSHWLALGAVAVYRPRVVEGPFYVLDLAVSALMLVAASALVAGLIDRALSVMHHDEQED